MATRQTRVELRGFVFVFTVDALTNVTYSVTVEEDAPVERLQTFDLPLNVDPMSYALGWVDRHIRDVIHLL